MTDDPPPLDIDDLRRIARQPQLYSTFDLADALDEAIDRLDQAERERDELRRQEANYLTFGQGGSDYVQSQSIATMYDLECRAEQAEARADRLQEALLQYGKHAPPCQLRYGPTMDGTCKCGLYRQLYPEYFATLAPQEDQTP